MVQSDDELTVAQRLGQLLDRGLLPAGGPAEAAERLIERLERPARVALLGLPGSGKSAILNLLTGTVVVPETLRLPTIIVQHGADPRMICTLTDGRTEIVPGSDLNDVLTLNPALVTLEMDLPALKVISLLEVSAGPMEAEQRRAAIWASKRADILIWCTTSYLPKEQQVWEGMPDVVKDNGFLFLTKTDLLGSREAAAGMLERVEMRAGEEFRQVLAISAKQARAAMAPGAPVDRELFRDSGAAAVITTIKSRVQAARRADTDTAELLLARHVEASEIVARRFAEPGEAPTPLWSPPPEMPAKPAMDREPVAIPAEQPEIVRAPDPVEEPEPEILSAPEPAATLEPQVEPETEREPAVEVADDVAASPVAEPEPEPFPEPAPEPEPEPIHAPVVQRGPIVETVQQPGDGRKRFSDRIKQMPMPDETAGAAMVPLRSTWKSKAETAAASNKSAAAPDQDGVETRRDEARAAGDGNRMPRAEPRARTDLQKQPEAENDDATLARMLASVTEAPPDVEDGNVEEDQENEADTPVADDTDLPRWAERLKPTDDAATADRSPRPSLFGSRKPGAAAPAPTGARPAERVARPAEPVTRVRAPAPRAPETPKPAIPSPEDLATPRFVAQRERPQPTAETSEPQRGERRERPRIAARAVPVAAPVAAAAESVPSAERELLDVAIRQIAVRAAELVATVDPEAKIPVDLILEHCRETIEQVAALLGPARSSGLRRITGDLGEIQDVITLMQLEKGHAPADDALTLLLQIRRDLETLRAA